MRLRSEDWDLVVRVLLGSGRMGIRLSTTIFHTSNMVICFVEVSNAVPQLLRAANSKNSHLLTMEQKMTMSTVSDITLSAGIEADTSGDTKICYDKLTGLTMMCIFFFLTR